jgi:hypothetical protein
VGGARVQAMGCGVVGVRGVAGSDDGRTGDGDGRMGSQEKGIGDEATGVGGRLLCKFFSCR